MFVSEKCLVIFINHGLTFWLYYLNKAGPSGTKASDLGCSGDKLGGETAACSSARSGHLLKVTVDLVDFSWEKNSVVLPPLT